MVTGGGGEGVKTGGFSEEESGLFVTKKLISFLAEVCKMPNTWTDFPMETVLEEESVDPNVWKKQQQMEMTTNKRRGSLGGRRTCPVPLLLSTDQIRHAQLVMERSKPLAKLRHSLCPTFMDDDLFWKIYFLQTRRLVPLPSVDLRGSLTALRASTPTLSGDWETEDVDALRRFCEAHSFPDDTVRRRVYDRLLPALSSERTEGECEQMLKAAYLEAFGIYVPKTLLFPPQVNRHLRTEEIFNGPHYDTCARIVACLQLQQNMAPQVPLVVRQLIRLKYSEARVFCFVRDLIGSSLSHSARGVALHFFAIVLKQAVPEVSTHLEAVGMTAAQLIRPAFHTLFCGEGACVDRFLIEGWHAVVGIGIALVVLMRTRLVYCTKTQLHTTLQSCMYKHGPSLVPTARALATRVASSDGFDGELDASEVEEMDVNNYTRMRVMDRSDIVSCDSEAWEVIHSWFPARFSLGHTVQLVYSTLQHGISLRTLFSRAKTSSNKASGGRSYVLLVDTTKGSAFGAYLSAAPFPRDNIEGGGGMGNKSYGTGECFLFQLSVNGKVKFQKYAWNYASPDQAFIVTNAEGLSIGGNGLYLDNELRNGISRPSSLFNLEHSLCDEDIGQSDGSFQCVHCELWEIVPL